MTCMRISQMMAPAPIAQSETPTPDHGETEDNPRPVPRERRMTAKAADTNAPAMTAAQDMPEECASCVGVSGRIGVSAKVVCVRVVTGTAVEYSIWIASRNRTAKPNTTEPRTRYGGNKSGAIHRTA